MGGKACLRRLTTTTKLVGVATSLPGIAFSSRFALVFSLRRQALPPIAAISNRRDERNNFNAIALIRLPGRT